nr:Tox-REase-5 domain-containing protein [Archangium violaceum]
MAYLGWDTVWRLIDGWLVLMKEVDGATSFDELHAAGEKFGNVMGEKAARAFVMLAMVAMGNTASGMAATLPKLPGAGQAAVVAETQLNIRFTAPALAQVESVALSAEGVTIALAPKRLGHGSAGERRQRCWRAGSAAPLRWPGSMGPDGRVHVRERPGLSSPEDGTPKGYAYRVKSGDKEVDFDGFDQGVLLEAKGPGYTQWINKKLEFFGNFQGRDQLLDQAMRQFKAANGTPIRWIVAEEKLAGALRLLFEKEGLPIEVIHIPPAPRGVAVQ